MQNVNQSIYTALTIGPIYKTLSYTRRTRELWGASYLMSYIMRQLYESLKDKTKCLLPYHPEILAKSKEKGAGFFPDRLIYEGDIQKELDEASNSIIKKIADVSEMSYDFLSNYLRISTLTFSLPCEIDLENKNDINNNVLSH